MKKRKALFLLPVAALILSGCTFQEGWETVAGFFTNSVYEPVKGWVENLLGIKHEDKKEEQQGGGQQGGGEQEGGGEQQEVSKYGDADHPLSVSAANALIAEANPTEEEVYVVGEVLTNEAWNADYGQATITLTDGEQKIKVFRCAEFPEGFDKEGIKDNSMKGQTVVAKGIGEIYNNTYELTTPTVLSVTGEGPQHVDVDNYGTEQEPLTVSQANAVIDLQDPTDENLYVIGKVTTNTAWSSQYSNIDITISDGQNELTLFRANKFPQGYAYESLKKDELKGKIVVGKGIGTYYADGQKYELKQGCEVLSVADEVVPVTGVEISALELALEVGEQAALTASVKPDNASQELTWTVESDPSTVEVAKYENGKVIALAAGTALVTAKSVADPLYGASCTVTVTEATKTLESIAITGDATKTAYVEDEAYSAEGLKVMAHYDKGEDVDVTANAEITIAPEKATYGDVKFTVSASYSGKQASKDVAVTVSYKHGGVNDPLTGAEAAEIAAGLENKVPTEESYYIRGVVTKFNENFNASYGNYSFTIQGGFVGWRLKNGSSYAKFNEGDLELGDTVTMYVAIQNYDGTPESSGGYIHAIEKATAVSVVISGTATQTEYGVGTAYNHNGLVATATMDTGVERDVTATATWTPSKENAEVGDTSVSFTVTYQNAVSEPFAVAVTVSSGTVLVETSVYKLDGSDSTQGSNGYATVSEVTQSNLKWEVTANTTISPWRFGGKNITDTDRAAVSTAAVTADDVTKVVVETGSATATVNSVSLLVGSTKGASDISSLSLTSDLVSKSLEFARPANVSWAGRYFTIVFNVTCGGSNQYIQLVSAEFFAMK